MCDPHEVETYDISEASSQNSFMAGVVEDKENIEIFPTIMLPMKILNLELKLHMVAEIINLLYQ